MSYNFIKMFGQNVKNENVFYFQNFPYIQIKQHQNIATACNNKQLSLHFRIILDSKYIFVNYSKKNLKFI